MSSELYNFLLFLSKNNKVNFSNFVNFLNNIAYKSAFFLSISAVYTFLTFFNSFLKELISLI